jgi:hypothetical protein
VLKEAVFLVSLFGLTIAGAVAAPYTAAHAQDHQTGKGTPPLQDNKDKPSQPLEHGKTPHQRTTAVQAKISPEPPKAPVGKRIHERRPAPQVSKASPVPDENPSPPVPIDRKQ